MQIANFISLEKHKDKRKDNRREALYVGGTLIDGLLEAGRIQPEDPNPVYPEVRCYERLITGPVTEVAYGDHELHPMAVRRKENGYKEYEGEEIDNWETERIVLLGQFANGRLAEYATIPAERDSVIVYPNTDETLDLKTLSNIDRRVIGMMRQMATSLGIEVPNLEDYQDQSKSTGSIS